jgi:hypothetical protein
LEEKDHQLGGVEEEVLQDLLHTSMLRNDIILVLKCDLSMYGIIFGVLKNGLGMYCIYFGCSNVIWHVLHLF